MRENKGKYEGQIENNKKRKLILNEKVQSMSLKHDLNQFDKDDYTHEEIQGEILRFGHVE